MDPSWQVHARALARRVFALCSDYGEVEQLADAIARAARQLKRQAPDPAAFLSELGGELAQLHDDDTK